MMKKFCQRSLSLVAAAAMSVSFCTGGLAAYAAELPADAAAPVVLSEENLFLGKTATASSSQSANPPANAIDGDPTGTKWCAQPSSSQQQDPSVGAHWLQIDLGGLYSLDRIYFILEDKNNSIQENGAIYKYQIAVSTSDDISTDDIIIDRSDNTEMIWTVDEDLGGVVCRYVRIYLNCATPRNWPCIMEVYGYGTPYIAPQEEISLTLDYDGAVQQGDTFQVPLQLGGLAELSDPVYLMQMELTYPEGFSCTSIKPTDGIEGTVTYYQAPGETSCTVLYDADSFDTGLPAETASLFTATFAVASDTEPGSYSISMSEPLLITTIGNVLTADLTAASVTVEEKVEPVATYTVSFESNGGTPVDSQEISENGTVAKPEDPSRDGYTFGGWFTDETLENPYDFSQPVTSDFTLYAKWTEVVPEVTCYTVNFDSNGGSAIASVQVEEGKPVAAPADPTNGDFDFDGWYTDVSCTKPYDFTTPVTQDLTLYAGWKMVGPSIDRDDTDTPDEPDVEAPDTDTDIDDDETPLNPTPSFSDVPDNHWAKEAIDYVAAEGLFTGTSATTFSPDMTTTRAMLMTVLARMDGVDTAGSDPWYAKGMEWAVAEGVSDGTNPEMEITREQLAVMLYRYAGSPAVSDEALTFADADQVSDWAMDGVRWAVANGILSGKGNDTLDPLGIATRAEVAQMLYRFVNL